MVFEADTQTESKIDLVDAGDNNGNPVVVGIKPNVAMQQLNNARVNLQASIFPVKWDDVKRWNQAGDLRYYNDKSPTASVVGSNPQEAAANADTPSGFDVNIGLQAATVKVVSKSDIEGMDSAQFKRSNSIPNRKVSSLQKELIDAISKHVDNLTNGWVNAPTINVVYDMNDTAIPEAVRVENERQLSQGATGEPEGFYYRGEVYVLASQMRSADDVVRVVFHEVLGHGGLRGLYGKGLERVLTDIAKTKPALVKAKAEAYGLKLNSKRDRLIAAEEVLAEMAQTRPEIGYVKRAIAAIRTWLRENVPYFKNMAVSDNEIINNFILPARNFIERGGNSFQNGNSLQPAFSRQNPKQQNLHPEWGDLPEDTSLTKILRKMQDKHVDLKAVVKAIEETGVEISDHLSLSARGTIPR